MLRLGKVGGFNLDRLEAFFRSSDHRPPHLHIKKAGEWEIRVYIATTTKNNLDYSFTTVVKLTRKTQYIVKHLNTKNY